MAQGSVWRLTAFTVVLSLALLILGSGRALQTSSLLLSSPTELDEEESAAVEQVHKLYAKRRRASSKLPRPVTRTSSNTGVVALPEMAPSDAAHAQASATPPALSSARRLDFRLERPLEAVLQDTLEGKAVFLSFANSAVTEIALNWAAHVERIGRINHACIAALDRPLLESLLRAAVPSFRHFTEGLERDVRSSRQGFRRLGVIKAELVIRVIAARRHVILSDVDVLWLVAPSDLLKRRSLADVMVSTDCLSIKADEGSCSNCTDTTPVRRFQGENRCAHVPGNGDGHAAFNTGIMYFSASPRALAVAVTWLVLLSRPSEQDIDDQLAFNHIIWSYMRSSPSETVVAAGGAGLGMINCSTDLSGKGFGGFVTSVNLGWQQGWAKLANRSETTLLGQPLYEPLGGASLPSLPRSFVLAVLPTRHFCSGHLYWLQQGMQRKDCVAVHTSFTQSGTFGKIFRWREAHLWLLEPEYYRVPATSPRITRRFLTFTPPTFQGVIKPCGEIDIRDALLAKNDKYKAGWLPSDVLRLSPRLYDHLELMRRHRLALRDALALARSLGRTLVLPPFECLCDRSDAPSLVLPACVMKASELQLPFLCPMTHMFDLPRLMGISTHADGVPIKEHSYLEHPATPPAFKQPAVRVAIASSATEATQIRATGRTALVAGSSDAQARRALEAIEQATVVHLERAEGVFGGWEAAEHHQTFEWLVRHFFSGGSWCCTSYFPPQGTLIHADPMVTAVLPRECAGAGSEGAWDDVLACRFLRAERQAAQRPFHFNYTLSALSSPGKGFYGLERTHA